MTTSRLQRAGVGFAVFTLLMLAILIGLGVWQLQRRVEKHALIAALTERLAEPPVPLPDPSQWPTLSAAHDEFRRVSFTATYERAPDAMVYSSGSAVRADISGPGTWAFLPAHLPSGETVVVNAGFVENAMQDRAVEDRAIGKLRTDEPVMMVGYLRFPEEAGLFTPAESKTKRLWFARDQIAMASALGWGAVAPFYIDLESPAPANGIPKPGPLQVHLRDDHMQYAITWFSLAALVAIAFGIWLDGKRRVG
jgi:cytochrome oxidase assembly protein ShyY1